MSAPIFNIVPNVIVPNDFYLPNTLTPYQCNMAIGINDVGYGESLATGFYNGFTPPAGGWTIYYTNSSRQLFTQVAQNDTDFLEITNYLSNNNYTNIGDAIIWYYGDVNQLGGTQILANYDLPNFVTGPNNYSELALCFLSGYSMSFDYNLFGIEFNYWIDLAQSNFLTINGTFAIAGSGAQTSIVFDGTTTYGSIAYSGENFVPIANTDYTISVWFNPSNIGGAQGLVGWGNYGTTDQVNAFRLNDADLINYWFADDLGTEGTGITNGNWYNAVCSYNSGTNTRSIYLNGSLIASDNPTGTHAVPNADNLTIGVTNGTEYFNGKIQNVNIYNICLTPQQILQNYYALQPIIF